MAELRIEGIPQPVQVDSSFADLTPEQQSQTVEEIRRAWEARQQRQQPPTSPAPDTSYGGAIRHSAHALTSGLGATARVLGDATGSEALRGLGQSLSGAVTPNPSYSPATSEVIEGIRALDLARTASNLPRFMVEQAGGLGATLAGGAVGGAVAGPPGAFAGATLAAGAQNLGPNVEQRAANNGREQPSTEDLVVGGLTTAAQSGLEAFGAVGRGARAVVNPISRPSGVVARAQALAQVAAREGVSELGDETVQQVGTSLGTERGLHVDPAEVLAAGLGGAATRGAMGAPGAALRGGLESSVRIVSDMSRGEMSTEEAASVLRVNHLLSRRFDHQSSTRPVEMDELLNGARTELDGAISRQLRRMRSEGWLNGDDEGTGSYQQLRDVFETARRHNQNLDRGSEEQDGYSPSQGLQAVDEVLSRAPEALRDNVKGLLRDLDTLSAAARRKNVVGPFGTLGGMAGRAAAVAGGAAAGGLPGALAGAAMSIGGDPLSARVGRHLGGMVDRAAGLGVPAPVLARTQARRVLERAGRQEDRTSSDLLRENAAMLVDRAAMRRAALGLAPRPQGEGVNATPIRRASATLSAVAASMPPGDSQEVASGSEALPGATTAGASPGVADDFPVDSSAPLRRARANLETFGSTDTAPEAPQQERPRNSGKGALRGWRAFVQNGIGRKGRVATLDDIEGAVRSLSEDGTLAPEEAAAMISESGRIEDYSLLDEVMERLAHRQGWRMADAPDAQLVAGGHHYAGIHSPARWESAKDSYQTAAERAVKTGTEAGDYEMAELANRLAVSTERDMPGSLRVTRVEALIGSSPDPITRARRSAFLRPLVARYRDGGE